MLTTVSHDVPTCVGSALSAGIPPRPICRCGRFLPDHTPEHERQLRAEALDERRWRDDWRTPR